MEQKRREFLGRLFRWGVGGWASLGGLTVSHAAPARRGSQSETLKEVPQRWWKGYPDGKVQCFLCPFT